MKAFRLGLFLLLSIFFNSTIQAQSQTYSLAADSAVTLTITGTSTLHGWTVVANEIKDIPATLVLNKAAEKAIENFSFGVVVNSMDGGRGAAMNSKITNALKVSEYPVITYVQNEPAEITDMGEDGQFKLLSTGTLKMVGQKQKVTIEVMGQINENSLTLKGSQPLKFSEFDIEPPSAMFGQIVCGDDIAVNFEFRYQN